jgi:hypothetical protein
MTAFPAKKQVKGPKRPAPTIENPFAIPPRGVDPIAKPQAARKILLTANPAMSQRGRAFPEYK